KSPKRPGGVTRPICTGSEFNWFGARVLTWRSRPITTACISRDPDVRSLVVINALEPEHSTCRWCERGDLNSVDSWFRSRFASKDPEALEPILGATTALALLGTLGVQLASDL